MKNVAIINTCIGGSTGKISVGLFEYLKKIDVISYFCYGRRNGVHRDGYYKIGSNISLYIHVAIARLLGLQGYGSFFPTLRLIKFLKKRKVDTVFIVSLHGYYINEKLFLSYLASNHINVVYLMIDEYAFLGKCGYSNGCTKYMEGCHHCTNVHGYPKSFLISGASVIYNMKKKAYAAIESIVFVGPKYTIEQAKSSPLLLDKKLFVLDEAIDTSFYTPRDTTALRNELGIKFNVKILVCIAPFSIARKGCKYFVELAKCFEGNPDYVFVHVGFDIDKSSIHLPSNYIPVGFLDDKRKLAEYYSLGDLFVFPSMLDTMPNACLEALSAGTPLLCFNISGMPYIADETVATFVEPENVEQMEEVVLKMSTKTEEQIKICREYALSRYDNQKYYSTLVSLVD